MSVKGVLFDYSGTLFRLQPSLDGLAGPGGSPLDGEAQAEIMRRMTAPAGRPDGLPEHRHDQWERRDLDPELHRELYFDMLRGSGVRNPELLYNRMLNPMSWVPYPDTVTALKRLARAGIPVGVVSNIAWDISAVFGRFGVKNLVSEYVLSYREGYVKPDPRLFQLACDRLGLSGDQVLMVGDSQEADGGAAKIGCTVAIVEPLPVEQRPAALIEVLGDNGL
jgi:HAD superfamily hydrolase (TIGR01509 family)